MARPHAFLPGHMRGYAIITARPYPLDGARFGARRPVISDMPRAPHIRSRAMMLIAALLSAAAAYPALGDSRVTGHFVHLR